MKLALFAHRFPSVSETFVADQVTALQRAGIEVHVYAHVPDSGPAHADETQVTHWPDGVWHRLRSASRLAPALTARVFRVWRAGNSENSWLEFLSNAGQLLPRQRYDAILAHFGTVGIDANLLRRTGLLAGPLCVVFHGFDITRYLVKRGPHVYDQLLADAEWLLPISQRWRDRLIELGADPARIRVHRMGVDCSAMAFRPRPWTPGTPLRLISVARLVEKKGIQVAIPAVAELIQSGRPARWDVVGGGPLQESLEAQAQAAGLEVSFHGSQSRERVAQLLSEAHVLLAPSTTAKNGDQEGIPVAIMEAMAAGLTVVSTEHSGIGELVEDGVSGYLAREGDSHDLCVKLERACSEHERWPELQQAARAKVEHEFNQATLNRELVEFVRALAAPQ